MTLALVTGGGGFLGRYIVEQLLARGERVRLFARGDYPELGQQGAELVRGDLCHEEAICDACRGVEVVYHVAAQPGLWGRYSDFYRANVTATTNLLKACQRHGAAKLIFTSSPSVIFDNHPHRGVDESYPYPKSYESPYPATKAIAEQKVLAANDPTALLTVSLRPHLIFGPRDRHLLPRIVARARAGRLIQVGDGQNRVDLCYVEDAARAHLLAADALTPDSPWAGQPFFITQAEPVVLWPWLNELLSRLDLPPVQRRLPLSVARAAGWGLEAIHDALPRLGEPRITRFLASELALDHYYAIDRARAAFGYQPQFTMAEALAKTLDHGIGEATP